MAASGSAVTVLTPNGRRQTVKVSPNTPLLQVLEDVCKKHGFDPEDHGLKFQRTVLDLTVPWRFANLPNNAKLEMMTSTRKQSGADGQVRVALQMEDGSRLQGSFSSGQSLWELVTHFPQISVSEMSRSGATPVCVYMRDEVSGEEALKTVTLKSLGLTGGSAILRFLLRKDKTPEEQDETAAVPIPPVAKETASNPSSQPAPAPALSFSGATPQSVQTENSIPTEPVGTPPVPTPATAANTVPVQQESAPNLRPEVPSAGSETLTEDGEEAGPSELDAYPSSSSSSSSSSAPSAPFIPFSGGGQRLGGPGGETSASSSSSSPSTLGATVESPKAKKPKSSHGSNTKCKITANLQDREMDHAEEFLEPVEREPLIYHLDSTSRRTEGDEDLPDEFFEVTMDDVRKRFAQLKSERKLLEETPLMTKSMRESQMKEKLTKYPKVVLRVQFPDRYALQGFFRPLETVGAVRHFVTSHLEDPQLSFYLFITPPKTILNDSSATLLQADLFPGALVYFGSEVKTDFYLKRELMGTSVSALQANKSIASCMTHPSETSSSSAGVQEPPPPLEPAEDSNRPTRGEPDPPAHIRAPKPTRSDLGKVPKWLKLPGKK